jgi:hypothetical protein
MSEHTPGPWSVTEDGEICAGPIEASGICIGTLYCAEDYPCLDPEHEAKCNEEYKANARLIAAAPDMLDMLRRCEMWLSTVPEGRAIQAMLQSFILTVIKP